MSVLRVAAVQHDIAWERPDANFDALAPRIADAAHAGARLVLLSEMFAMGFSMAAERIAEDEAGPTSAFLAEQAKVHDVWVGGSVPERRAGDGAPANVFVLAGPDGTTRRFAKLHPFSYAGEHEHYAAGTEVVTWDVDGVRVTPFVCYDLRFGDEFWRVAHATDCYVVVANWPAARRVHWQTLLRARAIENQAYAVGVNRVGDGGGLAYAGDSAVIDPLGEVLASAAGTETTLVVDVDTAVVERVRRELPFLPDRRS
jgi:predicted amidohydrolase